MTAPMKVCKTFSDTTLHTCEDESGAIVLKLPHGIKRRQLSGEISFYEPTLSDFPSQLANAAIELHHNNIFIRNHEPITHNISFFYTLKTKLGHTYKVLQNLLAFDRACMVSGGGGSASPDIQRATSAGLSSTSSAAFVQKLQLATSTLPFGDYRVGYGVEIKNNRHGAGPQGDFRLLLNDSDVIAQADAGMAKFASHSGLYYLESISGAVNLSLEYRATVGTTHVRNAWLEIWRVT